MRRICIHYVDQRADRISHKWPIVRVQRETVQDSDSILNGSDAGKVDRHTI